MITNIGFSDKDIRLFLGSVLLGYGIFTQNWIGILGSVPILAALINSYPIYSLNGLKTCEVKSK